MTTQRKQKTKAAERAKAARRAAQLRKEAEERAEGTAEASESTPKRRRRGGSYNFTAEDIAKLRDEQGLSWRQVAVNLELGSPGAARKAYTDLTGTDYRDSNPTVKRAKTTMGSAKMSTRKFLAPEWNDDSDQEEIIGKCENARLIVRRDVKGIMLEEDIRATKVVRMSWDGPEDDGPLAITFIEAQTGAARTIRVADIKEVR